MKIREVKIPAERKRIKEKKSLIKQHRNVIATANKNKSSPTTTKNLIERYQQTHAESWLDENWKNWRTDLKNAKKKIASLDAAIRHHEKAIELIEKGIRGLEAQMNKYPFVLTVRYTFQTSSIVERIAMSQFEKAVKLSDEQFLRVVGVDKATF